MSDRGSERGGNVIPPVPAAALDLRDFVRPGDTIVFGQGAGEPLALTQALFEQCEAVGPVRAFTILTYGEGIAVDRRPHLQIVSTGAIGVLAGLARAGALDVVPVGISALDGLFASGRLACDVVFVQLSPADAGGWHRLGTGLEHLPRCIDRARVVLAEVNDRVPVSSGPYRLHTSRLTATVTTSRPLVQVPSAGGSPEELVVARHVADLVPDGATVQFGIGRLPDAIAAALVAKRKLRVHSGMVTDALVDLVEAGAIDTSVPSATTAAIGTDRLYALMGSAPWLELQPYTYTHAAEILNTRPGLVAMNSALEVDLTGQVAAEQVGPLYVGAIGGQVDFLRGAAKSPGGVPIVALASTTRTGRSRIVGRLESGVVTTPRSDVGLVVTEHGVADLRGRTLRERAEALIAIADPGARDELRAGLAWAG